MVINVKNQIVFEKNHPTVLEYCPNIVEDKNTETGQNPVGNPQKTN